MAFVITKNKGEFWLRGNLTISNANYVRKHFELILNNKQHLEIHLDKLDSIDTGSIFELQQLKHTAYNQQKNINFTGQNSYKIKEAFLSAGVHLIDHYQQSA